MFQRTLLVALSICGIGFASAEDKLSTILPNFFVDGVTLVTPFHTAHFEDGGAAFDAMGQFTSAVAGQFATYPLGSSSGAFTFALDPETGAYVPTSESFGPIFAERPETLGKNMLNFGVTALSFSFDAVEGLDLAQGDVVFNLTHEDPAGDGPLTPTFEGDLITSELFLALDLRTTLVFGNWGVTDQLDLGVVVPWVEAEVNASVRDTIFDLGSSIHDFAGGDTQVRNNRGKATGVGDVVLRSKYNFHKGLAMGFDLRLPTGDEDDLLGSGATQARLMFIARGKKYDVFYGGLHPHLNLGYTFSSGDYDVPLNDPTLPALKIEPADEINYALGFDTALGKRITLAIDVLGRVLLNTGRLSVVDRDFLYRLDTDPDNTIRTLARPELVTTEGDLSIILGTAGIKVHAGKNVLLSLSAIVPIADDRGLEDDFAASLGLDYTF